jgi:hypothetical protein
MKDLENRVLSAAVSLLVIVGTAVQVLAEERPAVPPSVIFYLGEQEADQPSLAEQYLFRLAETSKGRRMVRGGVYAAAGAGLLAYGISMLGKEDEVMTVIGGFFVVSYGVLGLAAGAYSFVGPGRAERTYTRMQAIPDAAQRERACEDALARLAKKGLRGRMIWGGVLAALAVSAAISTEQGDAFIVVPASFGATALYLLLAKSAAEKANRAYLEKRPLRPSPTLVFGLAPRGGFRLGLSMDF